jgi:biopolymer transport protein ExbD
MKCKVFIAASLVALLYSSAQNPPLQRGISVQLAPTTNAEAMPEADDPNAWIVTITADGGLYFGITPVTSEGLYYKMKARSRKLPKKLYVKADARAPYSSVGRVLAGVHSFFDSVVVLTLQAESATPGSTVPPRGIEVLITAPAPGLKPSVELQGVAQGAPALTVNHEPVAWDALPRTLENLLQDREKVVPIEVAGAVPFAQVVHVADVCHPVGVRVVLPAPTL